jgi:hypothetical protein
MSHLETLQQHRPLSCFDADLNVWSYTDSTPAADFHNYLTPGSQEQLLLCATFKTGGDSLVLPVLQQAKEWIGSLPMPGQPLTLIPCAGIPPFAAIALLAPDAHSLYQTFDPLLHRATCVVFPVHSCELSGGETPELVRLIRHDFLPSLEWDRQPHPKLRASFHNSATGVGSVKKKPGLASLSDSLSILRQMEGYPASWLRVQNWLEEEMKIEFRDAAYHWRCSDARGGSEVALQTMSERLRIFCVQGMALTQ